MLRRTAYRLAQHVINQKSKSKPKREGDISSVFASLSNEDSKPLPERFKQLKRDIVGDKIELIYESWKDLLGALEEDIQVIKEQGNAVVPVIEFDRISKLSSSTLDQIRHRGVCVVRGVFPADEALSFKEQVRDYIKRNPTTKGFPANEPQVFELYWSPPQLRARADPRMLTVQSFFLSLWHSSSSSQPTDLTTPLTYADRLRIRLPGDSKFALGPHVDGGGIERWEDPVYRSCYSPIFDGRWREYDPFEVGGRGSEDLQMNLYESAGGCSVFRGWQGWLSLSSTGPSEGTLRVLPLTKTSTAYWLLRPFFSPSSSSLSSNWTPTPDTPFLHGANPGRGQEHSPQLHPHLELDAGAMVSVPRVEPGDVVMWQGDLIHAVESVHKGKSDSSVMYIPAVAATPLNEAYIAEQRESFLIGRPPPDFPGGVGETSHFGRGTKELISQVGGEAGLRAMGF